MHPTAYSETYEPRGGEQHATKCNVAFVKSVCGGLKLTEIVLSILVFICVSATSNFRYYSTGGFCNFVAAITLICAVIFYIFYLFDIMPRLGKAWIIIEFVSLLISTFFWFVAMIVGAANSYYGPGAIATSVFAFIAMVIYIVELVIRFRITRSNGTLCLTMTGVSSYVQPPHQPAAHGDTAHSAMPASRQGPTFAAPPYPDQEQHPDHVIS